MCLFGLLILIVVVPARPVAGQGLQYESPFPDAFSAFAEWEINHEPIVANGLTYYPTRETRMFDGQVMMQVDVYEGVPVYTDVSRLLLFELVFVPLTPTRMRTYERGPGGERWFISGRGRFDIPPVGIGLLTPYRKR